MPETTPQVYRLLELADDLNRFRVPDETKLIYCRVSIAILPQITVGDVRAWAREWIKPATIEAIEEGHK